MARKYLLNLCHDLALSGGAIPRRLQQMEADLQPLAQWLDEKALPGEEIELVPWGWDRRVVLQYGLHCEQEQLDGAKALSSKAIVEKVLQYFEGMEGICGESCNATTIEQVEQLCPTWKSVVVKQIHSSSGRGLRFVDNLSPADKTWIARRLRADGMVVVQPRMEAVLDAALEFEITHEGATFTGYSVFFTERGAWKGNLVASPAELRQMISRRVGDKVLDLAIATICRALEELNCGRYKGPVGVDMLACNTPQGPRLMPCIEVNARTTMGMLAQSLWQRLHRRGILRIGPVLPHASIPLLPQSPTRRNTAWLEPKE